MTFAVRVERDLCRGAIGSWPRLWETADVDLSPATGKTPSSPTQVCRGRPDRAAPHPAPLCGAPPQPSPFSASNKVGDRATLLRAQRKIDPSGGGKRYAKPCPQCAQLSVCLLSPERRPNDAIRAFASKMCVGAVKSPVESVVVSWRSLSENSRRRRTNIRCSATVDRDA
jgi:hypothetical protein